MENTEPIPIPKTILPIIIIHMIFSKHPIKIRNYPIKPQTVNIINNILFPYRSLSNPKKVKI